MAANVFEAALGISAPWSVGAVEFDVATKVLTVPVDFKPGTRFPVSGHEGLHPVHDTVVKNYRHLNFFQHECHLQVRTPRVKLPNGSVRLVEPDFAGRLSGFTLLFEALVVMLAQQMPFAAVARIVGESAYRCMEVCKCAAIWRASWPGHGPVRPTASLKQSTASSRLPIAARATSHLCRLSRPSSS